MRRSPRSPRADAIEPLQKAFDLVDQIAAKDPNDATFRDRVGTAGLQLGDVLRHIDPRRAISIYARTLQRLRETHDGTALLGPRWDKYAQKPFQKLEPGMVFTIEPRLAVAGKGVVTVEDMVVLTESGAEWLSDQQKELWLVRS